MDWPEQTHMKHKKTPWMSTHMLLEAAPEEDTDDWFLGDLLDMESSREEKVKAHWMRPLDAILARLERGEFDHHLEDLFANWSETGHRDAINKTKWLEVVRGEMDDHGITEDDIEVWARDHHKPKPLTKQPPTGGRRTGRWDSYFAHMLWAVIIDGFATDVWNEVHAGIKNNPYKWDLFHYLRNYVKDWLIKHGYWRKFTNDMSEAKSAINGVVESGDDFSDLMRMDPFEGFNSLKKEPMIEAAWNKPMNLRRDPEKARLARIVNTVEDFILEVGSALNSAGYDVTSTQSFEVEDGIENQEVITSPAVISMSVDWAADWLVKRGHMKPEEVAHLREMFS